MSDDKEFDNWFNNLLLFDRSSCANRDILRWAKPILKHGWGYQLYSDLEYKGSQEFINAWLNKTLEPQNNELKKIIEQKNKEIEELRIMDESYKLNWANDRDIINKKDEEIERLKKDNEKYKKALEFYANEMSYSVDDYRGISGEMITRCVLYSDCEERNDVYSYAGRRARQALSEVDSER